MTSADEGSTNVPGRREMLMVNLLVENWMVQGSSS